LAFYRYFHDECGLVEETKALSGLWQLAMSAGWALPRKGICWVSERHSVVHLDEQHRIHCETGPAIQYPDGWSIYAIHGVRVPELVIMHPEDITTQMITDESNEEVRRVMISRMG